MMYVDWMPAHIDGPDSFHPGAGRVDRGEDEMDFARPQTTKVLKSKRVPSSAASTTSTGSLGRKSGLTLTKSASASSGNVALSGYICLLVTFE